MLSYQKVACFFNLWEAKYDFYLVYRYMTRNSFDLSFVECRTLPTLHIIYPIIMILDYKR